ncbi:hypothetical protein MVES_001462 [Malassezia vespertilionis]|uniref:YTH domain-containing protein n=1 Tax=Malassezia vespertilionis TaxID=2020962 RepID=A0A2N1JCY7_9BASI|nr:hypothetical protein MVES_001462 [Malassezia vespertilionis]
MPADPRSIWGAMRAEDGGYAGHPPPSFPRSPSATSDTSAGETVQRAYMRSHGGIQQDSKPPLTIRVPDMYSGQRTVSRSSFSATAPRESFGERSRPRAGMGRKSISTAFVHDSLPTSFLNVPRHSAPQSLLEAQFSEARTGFSSSDARPQMLPIRGQGELFLRTGESEARLDPKGDSALLSYRMASMQWPPPKLQPGAARRPTSPPARRHGSLCIDTSTAGTHRRSVSVRGPSSAVWPPSRSELPVTPTWNAPRRNSDVSLAFGDMSLTDTPRSPSGSCIPRERSPLATVPQTALEDGNGAMASGPLEYPPYWPYGYMMAYSAMELPVPARAFVIKSFTEIDVEKSLIHGVWSSTERGNRRLNDAWRMSGETGPIYLFYSVNGSGRFCGIAQMTSGLDYSRSSTMWAEGTRWKGLFSTCPTDNCGALP